MSCDKLENSHKNVPDEFKCGKCRKILIDACQTRCGCRFCRSCVDEMMNNGCQFCPGITSDCKAELLSNVVIDYRANKQISQLIMKCPEEMCSYEKLIENFQLENINHNKTLIDIIDNIKNEVGELREKELKNHEEINKLKDEKLESINKEMEMMKKEKLEMENRLKNHEEINKLKDEKLESINKEMEKMKEMENRLKNVEEMFNVEIRLGINQKINQLEIFVENKMKGIFEMMIDNIDYLRNRISVDKLTNEVKSVCGISSEYFYTRIRPYKLQLHIESLGDILLIWLRIHDDVVNLPFPFKADVTIKFTNKKNRELSESTPTKYCEIEKPKNNSYNKSDLFEYRYSELIESGILESNSCFIVECCVELR